MSHKIFTADQLKALSVPGATEKLFRDESGVYWMMLVTRDHVPTMKSERHDTEADIYIVLDGEADLYLGGAIVDQVTKEPGQHIGSNLDGAEKHRMKTGDCIVIPAGVPHMVDFRSSRITYLVVKEKVAE